MGARTSIRFDSQDPKEPPYTDRIFGYQRITAHMSPEAWSAIATGAAAAVALGLGLRAEWRANKEAKDAAARAHTDRQLALADEVRRFHVRTLLSVADLYGEWRGITEKPTFRPAIDDAPSPHRVLEGRIRATLAALPSRYATLLRYQLDAKREHEHGEKWLKYAPKGYGLSRPVPEEWILAELADDIASVQQDTSPESGR